MSWQITVGKNLNAALHQDYVKVNFMFLQKYNNSKELFNTVDCNKSTGSKLI